MRYVIFDSGSPVPLLASESKTFYFPRVIDIDHPYKSYFMRPAYELFMCNVEEIPAYRDALILSKMDSNDVKYQEKWHIFLEQWCHTLELNGMPFSFMPFGPFRFRRLSGIATSRAVTKSRVNDDLLHNVVLDTLLIRKSRQTEFMSLLTDLERNTLHLVSIEDSDWVELCVYEQADGFKGEASMLSDKDRYGLRRTKNMKGFIDSVSVPKDLRLFRVFGHSAVFFETNLIDELLKRRFISKKTIERCVYQVIAR